MTLPVVARRAADATNHRVARRGRSPRARRRPRSPRGRRPAWAHPWTAEKCG